MNAKDLKAGDEASGNFLVLSARNDTAKNGKPYVAFDCRAEDGTVFNGCKIWNCSDKPEGVIELRGSVQEFKGQLQIVVKEWSPSALDGGSFEPKAPWHLDLADMHNRLDRIFETISDDNYREFVRSYIEFWSTHRFPDMREVPKRFSNHPGAKKVHHAYRHGLLEHTLEVTEHAIDIAKLHKLNKREHNLLIIGCLIHDLGKMEEFEVVDGVYEYTLTGQAYGWTSNAHLYIGGQMLIQFYTSTDLIESGGLITEEDMFALQNIIMSHHGEWSDIKPKFVISMIAHCADMASSQTNRMRMGLATTDKDEVERDVVRNSYLRLRDYE